jgi:hypothetical protein
MRVSLTLHDIVFVSDILWIWDLWIVASAKFYNYLPCSLGPYACNKLSNDALGCVRIFQITTFP